MPSFKVNVDTDAEEYQLTCTAPVAVVGEWALFGEPAYVEVAGLRYWCHFDQAAYLPVVEVEEGQGQDVDGADADTDADAVDAAETASEAEIDAANEAAARALMVHLVGHGTKPVVEFVQTDDNDNDGSNDADDDTK